MNMELANLVDKNLLCITRLFYYGHLPYKEDTIDESTHTAEVSSEEFINLRDIQSFLSEIYVEEEVDRLLFHCFEGKPLYFEEEGVLKISVDIASAAGLPRIWEDYSIEVESADERRCEFLAKVRYIADKNCKGNEEETYHFSATKTTKWKLEKTVYLP